MHNSDLFIIPKISQSFKGVKSVSYLASNLWNNLSRLVWDLDTLFSLDQGSPTFIWTRATTMDKTILKATFLM